jgi:hypothetical protein
MNRPKKFEKKCYYIVDYTEIESLIIDNFTTCTDFSVHADQEVGRQLLYLKVEPGHDDWEVDKLRHFIKTGNGNYILSILLNELCCRRYILPGDYLIDCS